MTHLSQNNLDKLYGTRLKELGKTGVEEIKNDYKPKPEKLKQTIFLCHSHLDKTIVNKILVLFKNLNIDLYVDWRDGNLPPQTDKNTATAIRDKILFSDKFLFLATYNSVIGN